VVSCQFPPRSRRFAASQSLWRFSGWGNPGPTPPATLPRAPWRNASIIGLIMASFFAAGVVTQFFLGIWPTSSPPTGAGSQPGCLRSGFNDVPLTGRAPWFALTRIVQGASAGAIEVASMSAWRPSSPKRNAVGPSHRFLPRNSSASLLAR